MEHFIFLEKSQEMFDAVCNVTPWFVRHFTRNGLLQGLTEELVIQVKEEGDGSNNNGKGEVTEDMMYIVCRKVTPPQHLDKVIKVLDELRSTTTTTTSTTNDK